MKKLLIYLGIIVLLFGLLYALNAYSQKNALEKNADAAWALYNTAPENLSSSTVKQLDDPNYQNIILPDELETRLANEEDVIVYFFSPDCSYCRSSTPILTEITEETDTDVMLYNLQEFDQGFADYEITSTPTTVVFKNGEEEDRFIGGFSKDEYRAQMKHFLQTYATAKSTQSSSDINKAS